jgi:hypothetical protein
MTQDGLRRLNENAPWSDPDLFDLQSSVARGDLAEETAALLKRSKGEILEKIRELRLERRTFDRHSPPKEIELAYRDTVARRARQSRGQGRTLLKACVVLGRRFCWA